MERTELMQLFESSFPFWAGLSPTEQEHICESSRSIFYKGGQTVHDSSECSGVILVRSGCLRLYILSEDGKSITLYRLFPGDMCMLSASCVIQAITFDVFVDAEADSECVVIAGPAFATLSEQNKDVKIFALETAVSRFSDVMWVMQQVLFMSMDKRLAIFLLDESAKSGSDTVKLTHEQIAKYMGSAREVVSRMMKYFVSEGIVSASRADGIKLLDKKRLRDLAL
ncbi:MAG: Crp/Fnr family transcriptional regulator [Clostridia bacterium]|nr:Crp/Fnr family transcriptional regulator [Clostridia bacterium]